MVSLGELRELKSQIAHKRKELGLLYDNSTNNKAEKSF